MPDAPPQPAKDDRPTLGQALFSPTNFLGAVLVSVVSGLLVQQIVSRWRGR